MKSKNTSTNSDNSQITARKQRYVQSKVFVDPETGEAVPFQLVKLEDRDYNFHKLWLQNLVQSIDGIANQRLRLAFWIIDHLNKENQLVMTQRRIADETHMSMSTVIRTMKSLQEGDPPFLQKINSGAYRVNPLVIWKGSYSNRLGVCYEWGVTADKEATKKIQANENEEEAMNTNTAPTVGGIAS